MSEEGSPLPDLIRRVRSGDQDAAAEIVSIYQPHVLRAVRLRMRDSRLRLALDATDVCQSVMASFFARLLLGQFNVDSPEQLLRLLETMARNKVASQARKAQVTRREIRGIDGSDEGAILQTSSVPDPSRIVAERDLLEQFQRRMSHEERRLSDLRGAGREWAEIAAEVGSSPAALRKKLARALDRIARELGLDDDGN
jgi:RNA polymerase sigma-70 factor (ECF subfamily)